MARLVLIDPLTLLGNEVRARFGDVLGASHDVRLLTGAVEEVGTLTEVGGAAAVIASLGERPAETLEGTDLAIFCGEANTRLLQAMPPAATAILLGADGRGTAVVAGVNDDSIGGAVLVSPPATVVAVAHVAAALRPLGLAEIVATAIVAASEHGDPALHELFEQARSILTFTAQPPSPVFGRQLAFNLLPVEGGGAAVEASLRQVLGDSPTARVQVVQGGIFHGVSLSLSLRFGADLGEDALRDALASHPPIEWFDDPSALGPIDSAQSDSLLAGALRRDARHPESYWLWATMDNLTVGGAINALRVARAILGS